MLYVVVVRCIDYCSVVVGGEKKKKKKKWEKTHQPTPPNTKTNKPTNLIKHKNNTPTNPTKQTNKEEEEKREKKRKEKIRKSENYPRSESN